MMAGTGWACASCGSHILAAQRTPSESSIYVFSISRTCRRPPPSIVSPLCCFFAAENSHTEATWQKFIIRGKLMTFSHVLHPACLAEMSASHDVGSRYQGAAHAGGD